MKARAVPVTLCLTAGLAACGSRTDLLVADSSESPDASSDGADGAMADAPSETSGPDVGPVECTTDSQCSDGVACVVTRCDLATGTCSYTPDNSLCPAGFVCDASVGCVASGFVVDPSTLYGIELPTSAVAAIGPTDITMFDIALETDGTLYGVATSGGLWTIDTTTGAATLVNDGISSEYNALDAAPDGTLFAASGGDLVTIDPSTGAVSNVLTYPNGYQSSGDLAIMQGVLFATVAGEESSDVLLAIDLATLEPKVLGTTSFMCIYGLAAYGTTLFGFTCNGEVLNLDTTTGQGTLLATTGVAFYGASAR